MFVHVNNVEDQGSNKDCDLEVPQSTVKSTDRGGDRNRRYPQKLYDP